jgi:hypothetical protein
LLALAGTVAALPFLLGGVEHPFFLTIPIDEYSDESDGARLPPNAAARRDSDGLLPFFPGAHVQAIGGQERRRLVSELRGLEARKEKAVVVHLSAYALRHDGDVFLLPGDADLRDPATWLSLNDLLALLHACPAPHQLLILDIAHPLADARLGVLGNDVAEPLEARLKGLDDPRLLVLCPCAAGQAALASADLGGSVFGFYLRRGLSGLCDGAGPGGRRDERLTVRELYAFARPRVERWAWEDRRARQTPQLFGTGDFVLALGSTAPPELTEPPPYPEALKRGWQQRDDWWNDGSFRLAPAAFHQAEAALLRAEGRWRGGVDPSRVEGDLAGDLKKCEEERAQAREPAPAWPEDRPRSLAQSLGPDARPDPAAVQALRGLLGRLTQDPPLKPEQAEKERKEFRDKLAGKPPFAGVTAAAYEVLAREAAPGLDKVILVSELLGSLEPAPRFAELVLLQRLAAWDPLRDWPDEAVSHLLRAVREEERILADDPEVLGAFRGPLEAATVRRRQAEDVLFREKPSAWENAVKQLDAARADYGEVRRRADALRQARHLYDEALALLPGYEPHLADRPVPDAREDRDWEEAVARARDLAALLRGAPDPDRLRQATDPLQTHLSGLRRSFQPERVKQLAARAGQGGPGEYREIQTLLAGPRLSATDRESLRQAGQELARRLARTTLEQDGPSAPPSGGGGAQAGPPAAERAQRLARLSFALLQLAGLEKAAALEDELRQAARRPSDAAWESLGRQLRVAWAERLPQQLRNERDPAAADRISRVLDRVGTPGRAADLRRLRVKQSWEWLGQHYQGEADRPALAGGKGWSDFFRDVAQDCRRQAP